MKSLAWLQSSSLLYSYNCPLLTHGGNARRYAWKLSFKKTEVISKLWTVLVNVNHQLDEIQNHLGDDLWA